MPHFKKLIGKLCYLSPIDLSSAPAWTAWDNDLAVTLPLGDEAYTPATLAQTEEGIRASTKSHIFDIILCETEGLIGRCMLFNIDSVNRSAMLGIVIGEKEYWGRGIGQESLRLLLDYAFNLLNLNSVMLGVFSFNHRAIECYRRVGFKEIGRRRQARIIAGKAYDAVLMDILAEEFDGEVVKSFMAPYAGLSG